VNNTFGSALFRKKNTMRFSQSFIALALPFLVAAAPARFYGKRQASSNDILVMQFADVLEQLESQFYEEALAKFKENDFTGAGFPSVDVPLQQFLNIQNDEKTHSAVLQAALKAAGAAPVTTCQFDFTSVLTDVTTMAATARVVENVGVAAYIGATTLVDDKILLAAAASIATIESRHQTILNVFAPGGTAIPSPFDLALLPQEVLAIAGPFISGCDLGVPANPTLSVTNTGGVGPGTKLTFQSAGLDGKDTSAMHCQMLVGGATATISLPFGECVVPEGINGPVAIFITADAQPLIGNPVDRAVAKPVAGPTIAFIDTQPQALGQLARAGGPAVPPTESPSSTDAEESTTTRTLSPSQASALINAAGTPATDAAATATASATDSSAAATATDSASTGATATGTSSSSSAATPASTAASQKAPPAPGAAGGPNDFTGVSPDGAVIVNGWKTVSKTSS
jgi:hypothetical protein